MKVIDFEEFEERMDKKFDFIFLDGEKWYMGAHLKTKPNMPGLPLKLAYSNYLDWLNKK